MSKETAPTVTVASRELLPLKTTWLVVDAVGFRTKSVLVDVPDDITPQDIHDHASLLFV